MQVAPSQISPGEAFDVWYFIRNHTDATTYYVRAKLYDVRTGELLDTQNLSQSATNPRLFIKTVQSPSDPTGYGRNIVAIATVYTDSGYTTKSESYEEQEQYYLIKALIPFVGGGGNIDLTAFRTVVEDVVDKKLAPLLVLEPLELPTMPFDALFGALGALQREVNRIPKDMADFAPALAAIEALEAKLETLPKFEKTNLSSLQSDIGRALAAIEAARKENARTSKELVDVQKAQGATLADEVLARVESGLKDLMSRQELTIPLHSLLKDKQEQPKALDLSHLM
jgi:hypothetical protein